MSLVPSPYNPNQQPEESSAPVSEPERVRGWRELVLLEAGYDASYAESLARDLSIDLHRAVDLIEKGCPPETAAAILA